jgi:hypothetical protein
MELRKLNPKSRREEIVEKLDSLSQLEQKKVLDFVDLLLQKREIVTEIGYPSQRVIPYTFVAHRDPGMLFFKTLSNQKFRWLRIDPETHDPPYCCFFPVLQIWRLDEKACLANGIQHFTDGLSPQIKTDIKGGKCKLILDYANEGIHYSESLEKIFLNLIDILQPADQGIIFVQQNRVIRNSNLELFKESIIYQKIRFLHYDYFIKLIIDRITNNPAVLLDKSMNYPYYEDFIKQKNKILLCLNATPRPHRIFIYSYLKQKEYAPQSLLSFHGFGTLKGLGEKNNFINSFSQSYLGLLLKRINNNDSLEQIIDRLLPEYIVNDKREQYPNNLADDISPYLYKSSFFSVVTESDYADNSIQRITEKTIKAFAQGHPAIIVGNPHSLELVADLGFRLFENVVNPAYDLIDNPVERLKVILETIDKIALYISKNPEDFANKIYETSRFNCEHGAFYLKSKYEEMTENPLLQTISNNLESVISH